MHLYGIFDLMRVMRKWGHPQLAVCPRFPWQNQMCVPDLHLLQTHSHTHTHKTNRKIKSENRWFLWEYVWKWVKNHRGDRRHIKVCMWKKQNLKNWERGHFSPLYQLNHPYLKLGPYLFPVLSEHIIYLNVCMDVIIKLHYIYFNDVYNI